MKKCEWHENMPNCGCYMEAEDYCVVCDDPGTFICIKGLVYGPCEYEDCYAWCMNYGECECDCHVQSDD